MLWLRPSMVHNKEYTRSSKPTEMQTQLVVHLRSGGLRCLVRGLLKPFIIAFEGTRLWRNKRLTKLTVTNISSALAGVRRHSSPPFVAFGVLQRYTPKNLGAEFTTSNSVWRPLECPPGFLFQDVFPQVNVGTIFYNKRLFETDYTYTPLFSWFIPMDLFLENSLEGIGISGNFFYRDITCSV
jgi:hypothetical protein